MVWCGAVWRDVLSCGIVWCGVVCMLWWGVAGWGGGDCDVVMRLLWSGVLWCGDCGVVWCGVVLCGVEWCGVVCCGVVG